MLVGVQGLVGCTSVVIVSRCGVCLAHSWEKWFRSARYVILSPTFFPLLSSIISTSVKCYYCHCQYM